MTSTTRSALRAALVVAHLAATATTLAGCAVGDDSTSDDRVLTASERPAALGLGARGDEVHRVYDYLRRYGYFANPKLSQRYPGWQPAVSREPADAEVFDEALEEGVRLYQEAMGLPVTGVVDAAMSELMARPRCSMPDFYTPESIGEIELPAVKGYTTFGDAWDHTRITYRFLNYSSDNSQTNIRSRILSAMYTWSDVTTLKFAEVASGGDLNIGFYTGDHGDGTPFDGNGGVLAHADSPDGAHADLHFDDDEDWSNSGPYSMQAVTTHELGHALGLGHSSSSSATMYPAYDSGMSTLADDDRAGIWSRYSSFTAQDGATSARLKAGQGLSAGQKIYSADGRFRFEFQSDGNLVLYRTGSGALWSSKTNGKGADRVMMQEDGNLVMYKSSGTVVWKTGTEGSRDASLDVQNDGNVVIYNTIDQAIWSTGTCCH